MSSKTSQKKPKINGILLKRSIITGIFAGLFWGSIGVFLYYFNFSEVSPASFLVRPWISEAWTDKWIGDIASVLLTGIVSILSAIVYYSLLKKQNKIWVGVLYGIILWGVIFYLLQPVFTNIPALKEMSKETITSTICLFILYGTFIGYSISYDYFDSIIED
ncbi:YqhR family membrane protein [Virgibacillus sp. W0181]|uniref:YqhR family membrane protein n=1 Tax=Virgibacillus sp. W0181 TaxID=3391581 RepID=UPI003F454A38